MADLIRVHESSPASYPNVPGLSSKAAALNQAAIWRRIESYVAFRWSRRDVQWIVDGPGDWVPSLTPVDITTVEKWIEGAWSTVSSNPSPYGGFELNDAAAYRFTGSAGDDMAPPEDVMEAFRRLAEYLKEGDDMVSMTSQSINSAGFSVTQERGSTWLAKAMQNSGAADLLRRYRSVF